MDENFLQDCTLTLLPWAGPIFHVSYTIGVLKVMEKPSAYYYPLGLIEIALKKGYNP
jgi:hypothetical protein